MSAIDEGRRREPDRARFAKNLASFQQ